MDTQMWVVFGILVLFVFAVSLFRKDGHDRNTDYDRRTTSDVGMDSSQSDWSSSGSDTSSDSCDSSDSSCDSGSSNDD